VRLVCVVVWVWLFRISERQRVIIDLDLYFDSVCFVSCSYFVSKKWERRFLSCDFRRVFAVVVQGVCGGWCCGGVGVSVCFSSFSLFPLD
jgi:hypothetical protein